MAKAMSHKASPISVFPGSRRSMPSSPFASRLSPGGFWNRSRRQALSTAWRMERMLFVSNIEALPAMASAMM